MLNIQMMSLQPSRIQDPLRPRPKKILVSLILFLSFFMIMQFLYVSTFNLS